MTSYIYISPQTEKHSFEKYMPPIFTATSFTIAKILRQPQCPPTDEWINMSLSLSLSHTHTHTHTHKQEYYSAIKKNEILPFTRAWMDPESVMRQGRQRKTNTVCYNFYVKSKE